MSDAPRLRILVIGASGELGRAVVAELGAAPRNRHRRLEIGRRSASTSPIRPASSPACSGRDRSTRSSARRAASISRRLTPSRPRPSAQSPYGLGLANKLMGQVNLALAARDRLRDGGSITLIAGVLADTPIVAGSSASMVNGAIESFVMAAAIEMPRGIRINAVSPTVFAELMGAYGPFFRGFDPVPVARAARAFSRSVEGRQTGQVYKVAVNADALDRLVVTALIALTLGVVFAVVAGRRSGASRIFLRPRRLHRPRRAGTVRARLLPRHAVRRPRRLYRALWAAPGRRRGHLGADRARRDLPDRDAGDRSRADRQPRPQGPRPPAAPRPCRRVRRDGRIPSLVSLRRRLQDQLLVRFGRGGVGLLDGRAGARRAAAVARPGGGGRAGFRRRRRACCGWRSAAIFSPTCCSAG